MASRPAVRAWSTTVLVFAMLLATGPLRSQAPDSTRRDSIPAVLIGRVVDSIGVGLSGAEITLFKSENIRAITGDSGDFRLTGLPAAPSVTLSLACGVKST